MAADNASINVPRRQRSKCTCATIPPNGRKVSCVMRKTRESRLTHHASDARSQNAEKLRRQTNTPLLLFAGVAHERLRRYSATVKPNANRRIADKSQRRHETNLAQFSGESSGRLESRIKP